MPALEHGDSRVRERRRDLRGLRAMVVVVAEHGEHRLANDAAGVRKRRRLFREAVSRKVACEQHEIRFVAKRAECALEVLAPLFGGVDVSDRGHAEARHGALCTRSRFRSPARRVHQPAWALSRTTRSWSSSRP